MIIRYYKIFTFFLLVSFSCMAYDEKIVSPISMEKLPTSIEEQSPEETMKTPKHAKKCSHNKMSSK